VTPDLESDEDVGLSSSRESDADVGLGPAKESVLPQHVMAKAFTYAVDPSEAMMAQDDHEGVLSNFGQGFKRAYTEPLGMSDESKAWLQKNKIFGDPSDPVDRFNPSKAFNQIFLLGAASILDAAARFPQAVIRGIDTTITNDPEMAGPLQSLVEAIPAGHLMLGGHLMPGAYKLAPPKPFVRPVEIKPMEGSPNPGLARTVAAKTGDPLVDAILEHPTMKSAIDNDTVIDRFHSVPNSWSGSTPIENPTVYLDYTVPKSYTVDGVTFDPAEPAAVRENAEEFVHRMMTAGGMATETAQRVAVEVVGKPVENAWYNAHGIDPEKANAAMQPDIDRIAARKVPEGETIRGAAYTVGGKTYEAPNHILAMDKAVEDLKVGGYDDLIDLQSGDDLTQKLAAHRSAGDGFVTSTGRLVTRDEAKTIAESSGQGKATAERGIKSEDMTGGVPPDMFKGMYPNGDPAQAAPGPFEKPTPEQIKEGRALIAKYLAGEIKGAVSLEDARGLGVIGPEKPEPTFNDSPSDLAEKAVPRDLSAASTPEDTRDRVLGHKPGEYDQRGKEWIDKIDEPDGVRDVIEKIANDHDFFPEARGGVASAEARNSVAEAAGVPFDKIDSQYFSTHFDSDGKVRAVIQVLRQTAKDVAEASEKVVKDPSVENSAALAEAELRHTHALEYTMGLRAESGRTLAAWKDLLREQEHTKATTEIRKKEVVGDAPKGTADVVDAVKEIQDNLRGVAKGEAKPGKKLGIQNLIDQAKKLAEGELAPKEPGAERAPLSPEVKELTDAAKKVLKRFGVDKDANLDAFRQELERLSAGEGKLGDAVEAARELLKKEEKPAKAGEPKPPTDRAQLTAAAKRLVAAADNAAPEAKTPMPTKTRQLMEAARQAVGRLKTQSAYPELAEFRRALSEGDAVAAKAAAQRLVDVEAKAAPGQPKPPVEHDVVMDAARRLAKAGTEATAKEKPTLPKDITDLLQQAKDAAKEFGEQQKSVLDSLVDQAEREAVNMTKTNPPKEPAEALPPELQALVDKSKRVTDRFGGTARPERAALLLARTGKTVAEQEQLARSVAGLTPNQVAKVLEKVRTSKLAEQPKWYYWLWQQGLISGLITHTKYLAVNTAQIIAERLVAPTVAAGLGKLRGEDVSLMAPLRGNMAMIHQVPDAVTSALEAFRTGQRVPLASEMRLFERGEDSPQAKGAINPYDVRQQPDWGIWKRVFNEDQLDSAARVLGMPGRSANMIHTFFKVLSERAAAATTAHQAAFEEGATGDRYWQRYQYHLDNPTDDALRGAVNDAYSGAFMEKLEGGWAKASSAMNNFPIVGKWLFPFRHIPINIVRKGVEYSPMAVLDSEFRSALKGDKGAPAQNLAIAKMVVGSSIIGYFMHKAMADEATAEYPKDPKERREWQMTGKQPFSLKMGDYWVAMERLGPLGMVANLGSSLGSIVRHYDGQDDDALSKAVMAGGMAAIGILGNEAGFQSLRNAMDAMNGDEKRVQKFLSMQGASVVPSLLAQPASVIDPYQRKAGDLISDMKYRVPFLRESLPPKRDNLYGEPLPNPGYHSVVRQMEMNADPVRVELDRLKIYPTAPSKQVGNVTLPDQLYDKYEVLAGTLVKQRLSAYVNSEGWLQQSPFVRRELLTDAIKSARETARDTIQTAYPQLIIKGVQDKVNTKFTGAKPTKLKESALP
jgi:polyhydroxyalkanoate synthesis regulator phasin